ncbi:hypothetical protein [Paenibacillus polymyxa]|uniref:Uncharacterized protein n=1 Tax=Paenibacillus polymyxa (strain SC2) TaxID=886882 RepID=A0A0D5ZBN8_PAEPS|nr:hypothetical protein [Paenibacillus polymyxa]AKA44195.1 hypothetical protein PPSC2_05530 [Paenibacillus polymyxa SC2]WPQ57940.1 hypothetical protein SKN87_05645 [Paenibacillus polymyxa]CCC83974.1 hypothetical protein PPM_1037 [Paenibacillus polymyxa M1]
MNEETIAFKCGACQQVPDKPLLENKDFEIVAIEDTMDWADFKHDTPDLNSEIWERALNPPAEGDLKKVQVYFPFHMSVGETFWTLFRPDLLIHILMVGKNNLMRSASLRLLNVDLKTSYPKMKKELGSMSEWSKSFF